MAPLEPVASLHSSDNIIGSNALHIAQVLNPLNDAIGPNGCSEFQEDEADLGTQVPQKYNKTNPERHKFTRQEISLHLI